MIDQIKNMLQAMANNHELISNMYESPRGIFSEGEDEQQLTKLLRLNVARKAHDGSYRLESNLRRLMDKGLNRNRQFGISTHYQDILTNLRTAVESHSESLITADSVVMNDRLNTIFELCDNFNTGMTEDLEQFRAVVQTSAGFSGSTLEERIRYNENRLKRTAELHINLDSARDIDLIDKASNSNDLGKILQKEFFDRHGKLQLRLREVAGQLSQNLFNLQHMDEASLKLIRLDNHLTKYQDFETPSWESMEEPPVCFTRFEGFNMEVYADPDGGYADELGVFISKVKDDLTVVSKPRRNNIAKDDGPPKEKTLDKSEFDKAFFNFIEDVIYKGETSAINWWDKNQEKFNYKPEIWIQIMSLEYSNGVIDIPDYVRATPVKKDTNDELLLSDFTFEMIEENV
jgi:hypothetical protein